MIQIASRQNTEPDQQKDWENAIERLFIDQASVDERLKLILLHRMMGTGGFDSDRIVDKMIDSLADVNFEQESEGEALELRGFILGIKMASECI
ncbi:MAG: hypothetical protein OEV87_11600 [Phycisphaerae bacterium]|nr:hypothetical protein [Phycisphaerae bacterium]